MSERLRRWTRNPLGSARRGSNPLGVAGLTSPSATQAPLETPYGLKGIALVIIQNPL